MRGALVLIDIQKGFDQEIWGERNNPSFETNISELLEEWRSLALPVFHVWHDSFLEDSPLKNGKPGFTFMDCSRPIPGDPVITKKVNSAFIGTSLELQLRERGINRITLAGLTTDHCISTSARMASNLGFEVTIVSGGTATFERKLNGEIFDAETIHQSALASLNQEFARII